MTAGGKRWSSRRREHGAATSLAVVLVGVLTTVALAGAALGGVLVGQRRAAAAADLAALAAAVAAGSAPTLSARSPCAQAVKVSRENDARLSRCAVDGHEVLVEVTVEVPLPLGTSITVPGAARAGPANGLPTAPGGPRSWGGPAP